MKVGLESLVDTIRGLGPKFDSFHLIPCICDAPMWQQPCAVCDYYPQAWHDFKYGITHDNLRHTCSREQFCCIVRRHGSILEFYLHGFLNCVDPQKHLLQAAREKAVGLEFPSPEEIWDHFHRDDIDYRGHKKG